MMDFLRGLAPRRDTEATRAVAVLPSRFAESPLRASRAQASERQTAEREIGRDDDARSSVWMRDGSSAAHPTAVIGARSASVNGLESQLLPERDITADHDVHVHRARTSGRSISQETRVAEPTSRQAAATARPLSRPTRVGLTSNNVASAAPLNNRPLTDAAVAGRVAAEKRAPDAIVHVTIGRIDVVADPRAPVTPRPARTPRASSVTLADYLQRDGGRRP